VTVLDDLQVVVTQLCERENSARSRQLRWLAGELATYQRAHPCPDLASLLDETHLTTFLAAADAGAYRTRTKTDRPSPTGTQRTRRSCLRLIASAANLPVPTLPAATGHVRGNWTAPDEAKRALDALSFEAREPRARSSVIRAAFVATLVHHHNLRVGEIAALRLDDYNPELGTLIYVPDPPGDSASYAPASVVLADTTQPLAHLWLDRREGIAQERAKSLLVSVHPNHHNGVHRPAGLPVLARGLARSHERVVSLINDQMTMRHHSDPTWRPLPRTLGALRPRD
jgi:hypothetical protein